MQHASRIYIMQMHCASASMEMYTYGLSNFGKMVHVANLSCFGEYHVPYLLPHDYLKC